METAKETSKSVQNQGQGQFDRLLQQREWTPKELAAVARLLQSRTRGSQGGTVDQELVVAAASAWSAIETDDSRLLNAAATAWRSAAAIFPDRIMAATDLVGKPLHLPVLVAIASGNEGSESSSSGCGMQDLIRLVASNQIHPSVPLDYLVRTVDLISKHSLASASVSDLWPFVLNLLRHASLKSIRTTLLAATLRLIPKSTDPIQFILDNTLNAPISTRLYLLATALSSSSYSNLSSSSPLLAPTLTLAPTLLADPVTGPAAAAYLVAHHASTYPSSFSSSSSSCPEAQDLIQPWLSSWLLASALPLYPRLVASPLLARFPAARKLVPLLISSLVARDPAQYVPAAAAAVQALDLPTPQDGWFTCLAHVHANTDTRQFAAEIDSAAVVPLAWMCEPGVGPKPAYPWLLAGLRPGAAKADTERSLTSVAEVGEADVELRRAVLRALASPFAGLRTLATRVRLASGWERGEARAVWEEARGMLASRVPAARDGAARYLAVVCRDHDGYVKEAKAIVEQGEMGVGDVVEMNARLQLAADLRDVCGIEVGVEAWTWEVMGGWVEELARKVGELVSATTSDDDQDDGDDENDEHEPNSDGSDAKHLLVTTWHTLVLVSSRLVTLALAQPAAENTRALFPLLAQTTCTLRHAGAVQNVTRELVRLFRGLPTLQPTWRTWVWTMLSTPSTSASSSSTRLDTRYSGPRLVLRLVLDPSTPSWLDPLFSSQIAPHTALLLANGLLQDTALGPKLVHTYACAALDLALRNASDTDASVRSAAFKLIVNWSHRMLVLPNRSAAELYVQRPREAAVLSRLLADDEPRMGAVVGVLMVLGQVALGATHVSVPGVNARVLVETWLSHPIAHVRKLAGVAVARMATSVTEVREAAERAVREMLGGQAGRVGQNRVHGVLLLVDEMLEAQVVSAEWVSQVVGWATVWMCPVNELVRRQVLARVTGGAGQEANGSGSDDSADDNKPLEPLISPRTPLPDVLDLALHADPSLRLAAATAAMHLHAFRIPLAPYLTAWSILRAMSHLQLVALAARPIFPAANGTDPSLPSLVKSRMIAPTRGEGREWEDPVVTLVLVYLAGERLRCARERAPPAGLEQVEVVAVAKQVCARFEREWDELVASSATVDRDGLQMQLAFHPAVWTRLVQYRVLCALVGRENMCVQLDEALKVLEAVERVCCESVVAVEQRMVERGDFGV